MRVHGSAHRRRSLILWLFCRQAGAPYVDPELSAWCAGDASGFCLGADPRRKAVNRKPVTVDAEAGKGRERGLGGEGMVTETLAGVNIADVHLDGRNFHRHQSVMQRNRGVRIATGVDYDPGGLVGLGMGDEL